MDNISSAPGDWIVVQTQPNRENWAAENVARQKHEYYLPKFLQRRIDGTGLTIKPLFPRYMFVKIEGRWRFLTGTYGVSNVLIGTSGRPMIMPAIEISGLKAREILVAEFPDAGGIIQLEQEPTDSPGLNPGDKVYVKEGPLWGCKGIYQGTSDHHRQKILMEFLGGPRSIAVEGKYLEKI